MKTTGAVNPEERKRKTRGTSLTRLVSSALANIFFFYFDAVGAVLAVSIGHLTVSVLWALAIELDLRILHREWPGHVRTLLDGLLVTTFLYATGLYNSFYAIFYPLLVTFSSLDVNRKRGLFAVAANVGMYAALIAAVAGGLLAVPHQVGDFSLAWAVLSVLYLFIVLTFIHYVVFRTYVRSVSARAALQEARDALWGEMKLATKIQTVLLPREPVVPGYSIAVYNVPAAQVGGDYYDVVNCRDDWVLIGDASGHGVSAGLVMMMVQTAVRTLLVSGLDLSPAELLSAVNRMLHHNLATMGEHKYMTIQAVQFREDGQVVVSGLHQDMLVYRCDTGALETIESRGMWLGILEEIQDDMVDQSFRLERGDLLLLYSDGLTEAVRPDGNLLGDAPVLELLARGGTPASVKEGLLELLSDCKPPDDVTFVLIRREP